MVWGSNTCWLFFIKSFFVGVVFKPKVHLWERYQDWYLSGSTGWDTTTPHHKLTHTKCIHHITNDSHLVLFYQEISRELDYQHFSFDIFPYRTLLKLLHAYLSLLYSQLKHTDTDYCTESVMHFITLLCWISISGNCPLFLFHGQKTPEANNSNCKYLCTDISCHWSQHLRPVSPPTPSLPENFHKLVTLSSIKRLGGGFSFCATAFKMCRRCSAVTTSNHLKCCRK